MSVSNDFKWLCNPTNKDFIFQFDSVEYGVPAQSRKLLPSHIASHGYRASLGLSDPKFAEDGSVSSPGNDVYRRCFMEDADVMNPIGFSEPVIIEKTRDTAVDVASLSIDPAKPLKKYVKPDKKNKEVDFVEG
jgi:hypothetical protein